MKKYLLTFLVFLTCNCIYFHAFAQDFTSFMTGDTSDVSVNIQPAFVLAGGGTDNDEAMKWMLSRAEGGDVLVLRASGSDGYNSYFYKELDVNVHSVETILFLNKSASSNSYVLDRIKKAEVIFIAGGDQTKYFDFWNGTPAGDILKSICKNRTKVVGGTSAGMMILGNLVYTPRGTGVTSEEALSNPFHINLNKIEYNTFLQTPIFTNTFFDTHFDDRNRSGRLLVFLAKAAFENNIRARAIACNESTAVCIDENNIATVFGDSPLYPDYAYFMEVNCEGDWKPKTLLPGVNVQWSTKNKNAVIVQILKGNKVAGSKFDMNKWRALSDVDSEYWEINDGKIQKNNTDVTECSLMPSGLSDMESGISEVFPNPIGEVVYFSESDKAELFAIDGTRILSCEKVNHISTSSLKNGCYLLQLNISGLKKSYKLVKF